MIFFDTETCGLHGPIVLIQYAYDDGPVDLYNVWMNEVRTTLDLIEELVYHEDGICGFNLSFDWFHICQIYTTLIQFRNVKCRPIDNVDAYFEYEESGRLGPCLKPMKALDLMLHARKGAYQSTMNRDDIRIKRVPTALAYELVTELDNRIPLKDIYFARAKNKERWKIHDIQDDLGNINPNLKDIVLKFKPSSALKALAFDVGISNKDTRLLFTDVEIAKQFMPVEVGYAPFAKAVSRQRSDGSWNYNGSWPDVIQYHVDHWEYKELAREYAKDDVEDTRNLYKYFVKQYEQNPEPINHIEAGDLDSELACMVGAIRWHGYKVDIDMLKQIRQDKLSILKDKEGFNSTAACQRYLKQSMSNDEFIVIQGSTKGIILEEIAKWTKDELCECKGMDEDCFICAGDGYIPGSEKHPAALRAQEILDYRHAKKQVESIDKLIQAGRFHTDFNVIGTRSTRMSGTGGLNPQGIPKEEKLRQAFVFADDHEIMCGGDFSGFELTLAIAVWGDPLMHEDQLSGRKIHAIFGTFLYPHLTYEEIVATDGLGSDKDLYTRSKQGVFAILYGGETYTLSTRLGVSEEVAQKAFDHFFTRYKVAGDRRRKQVDAFCSLRQPGGIGSKVEWHEPAEYAESMFGFRRYFTLENQIIRTLYNLANRPPKHWLQKNIKITRRDREQSVGNAVRSALLGCAFTIQGSNMRAAGNHVIQSPGATITKMLQKDIWDLQPRGITKWISRPINIHDEIITVTRSQYTDKIEKIVSDFVIKLQEKVPLLKIKWKSGIRNWTEK